VPLDDDRCDLPLKEFRFVLKQVQFSAFYVDLEQIDRSLAGKFALRLCHGDGWHRNNVDPSLGWELNGWIERQR